jgi:adenylyltransferase/sulfurtransferase
MVVGAGAVGNEVLKNLALLGVGNLISVDFDVVEESNLSRTVLFTAADVGYPKAVAAAAAVRRLNPDVECTAINGDLELDVGLGIVLGCDLILGCVDSVNARWAINRLAYHAGVPWINAGINADSAEISLFTPPNGPCYECGMTDTMWKRFNERRSCMLLMKLLPPQAVPTTAVIASLAASLQVNEAICFLHGLNNRLRPGQKIFFSTNPYSFFVVDLPQEENCPAHERQVPDAVYEGGSIATVDELLSSVPGAIYLELDFDLLVDLRCSSCGIAEFIGVPVKRVSSSKLTCPTCGAMRQTEITTEVHRQLFSRSLGQLGIPSRAVLKVHTASGHQFIELSE